MLTYKLFNFLKVFLIALFLISLYSDYIRRCKNCGAEIDLEDYYNNICEYCGSTQGHNKECYENSELNLHASGGINII